MASPASARPRPPKVNRKGTRAWRYRKHYRSGLILNGRKIYVSRLAKDLGIDGAYLHRIMTGKRPPRAMSVGLALVLAKALKWTVEELVTNLDRLNPDQEFERDGEGRDGHVLRESGARETRIAPIDDV